MSEQVITVPARFGTEWLERSGDIAQFVLRGAIGALGNLCISLLDRIGDLEEHIGDLEEELRNARGESLGYVEVPDIDNI
jgi:hypothetical protein